MVGKTISHYKILENSARAAWVLGNKNEAIWEGIRATELAPITKDALRGFGAELDLAKIYTRRIISTLYQTRSCLAAFAENSSLSKNIRGK